MNEKLTIGQIIALGHYLCEWPENMSFKEILSEITKEHEGIVVAEDFEHFWAQHVSDNVEGLAHAIDLLTVRK